MANMPKVLSLEEERARLEKNMQRRATERRKARYPLFDTSFLKTPKLLLRRHTATSATPAVSLTRSSFHLPHPARSGRSAAAAAPTTKALRRRTRATGQGLPLPPPPQPSAARSRSARGTPRRRRTSRPRAAAGRAASRSRPKRHSRRTWQASATKRRGLPHLARGSSPPLACWLAERSARTASTVPGVCTRCRWFRW